jgi:outer membrane protein OmpA-like peptidoglycan-associated protein
MKALKATIAVAMLFMGTIWANAQGTINTVVTVAGHIVNAASLEPVECSYGVYDASGRKVGQTRRATISNGYLVTGLQPGERYTLRIEDPRFFKQDYTIEIPKTSKYLEVSKDFTVRMMEAGRKFMLSPNPFDLKKSNLKVGAEELLEEAVRILAFNPNVKVDVVCYPDADGLPADVTKQTQERGNALRDFMVKQGVSAQRITVKPTSTTDPLKPPPLRKGAKGKRYVGPVYVVVTQI